ncbi:hypothetical protein [Bacteroides congonensis]|uniref:hypothetical protein n=2 Tax=Bacteroides congonensis TaxID=1871006 RepID=UPI00255B24E9|nr:hypothetical protein [Bacteroides congonensis]
MKLFGFSSGNDFYAGLTAEKGRIRQVNSVRDGTEYPTAECKGKTRLDRLCSATRRGLKAHLRFAEGCREEYPGTVSEVVLDDRTHAVHLHRKSLRRG